MTYVSKRCRCHEEGHMLSPQHVSKGNVSFGDDSSQTVFLQHMLGISRSHTSEWWMWRLQGGNLAPNTQKWWGPPSNKRKGASYGSGSGCDFLDGLTNIKSLSSSIFPSSRQQVQHIHLMRFNRKPKQEHKFFENLAFLKNSGLVCFLFGWCVILDIFTFV